MTTKVKFECVVDLRSKNIESNLRYLEDDLTNFFIDFFEDEDESLEEIKITRI